jgi:hypothetical protein
MKVLFACGGTAGHINPAIAIADLLKSRNPRLSVLFVGTPTGMENRLVRGAGYPIRHIPVKGLRRSLSPANLRAVTSLFRSFGAAGRILDEETPDHSGTSPFNMKVTTVGDELIYANGKSKVIAIAGKDRSAIGLACRFRKLHPSVLMV